MLRAQREERGAGRGVTVYMVQVGGGQGVCLCVGTLLK